MEDWPPLAPTRRGTEIKKKHKRDLLNKQEVDSLVILCVLSDLVVKMTN